MFVLGAASQTPAVTYPAFPSEKPAKLQNTTAGFDFERREAMIPMRDGIRLSTVILVPNRVQHASILLTRIIPR